MDPATSDPTPQPTTWRICPVCRQPNSIELLHCQHCWGASLYKVDPIDSDELLRTIERTEGRTRRRRLTKIITVSVLAPVLLITGVVLSLYSFTDLILAPSPELNSVSAPGEWAMFRGDLTRSGTVDPLGPPPKGELKWKFETGDSIRSSPALAYDTIYVGSRDYSLYALDADTGEKKWEFQAESWIESSPTVVDGVVYFGSNDGYFYAVDAFTGEERWRFYTKFANKSSAAVADGRVYFGSDNYSVYSLDALTGSKVWEFKTGSVVASSPVIAEGILYVGSMDGSLYALQASNGRLRLRMKYREVASSPAVRDGVVYYNSASLLFAIDAKARNWPGEHNLRGWWLQFYAFRLAPRPPPISGLIWSMRLGRASSTTSPVVTDSIIYTTSSSMVHAVDTEEMRTIWSSRTGATIRSSPVVGNDMVYVGSGDGNLYALDARDGIAKWQFPTGGSITSSPLLSDGVIYVSSMDGSIYAIK